MISSLNERRINVPALYNEALHINDFPDELFIAIFKLLAATDLARSSRVCRKWLLLTNDRQINRVVLPSDTVGARRWADYCLIGEVPPLPVNIHQELNKPCPFYKDKKKFETHTLILIPKTGNENAMSFSAFLELIKARNKDGISLLEPAPCCTTPVSKSYWVLAVKELIPKSRNEPYLRLQALLSEQKGYRMPDLLEAAICFYMRQDSLSEHHPSGSYTRCQGLFNQKYRIGRSHSLTKTNTLFIERFPSPSDPSIGVAPLQRL